MKDSCPVCLFQYSKPVYSNGDLIIRRCPSCEMVFLQGGPGAYNAEHYEYYKNKLEIPADKLYGRLNEKRYYIIMDRLNRYRKNNRLLDVGCGVGHFVRVAKLSGWASLGMEIAPDAVQICKANGIDVIAADLMDLSFKEDFDVVTLFEVVEHLKDPRAYINKVRGILRNSGCMMITTPNFNSITRRMIGDRWRVINKEHLYYFTPKTLRRMVEAAGFGIISCETRNVEPNELLKFFKRDHPEDRAKDQKLRGAIEESAILRNFKSFANVILNMTGMGESIFMMAEKR